MRLPDWYGDSDVEVVCVCACTYARVCVREALAFCPREMGATVESASMPTAALACGPARQGFFQVQTAIAAPRPCAVMFCSDGYSAVSF